MKNSNRDQITLSELRSLRKLTQKELANELHVSNGLVGLYESGKRKPSLKSAIRIAEFFNVPVERIIFCSKDKSEV